MERGLDPGLYDAPQAMVTNWPGTLKFQAFRRRRTKTNMNQMRTDVWFLDHTGARWHGYKCSDNTDLLRCRRTKK